MILDYVPEKYYNKLKNEEEFTISRPLKGFLRRKFKNTVNSNRESIFNIELKKLANDIEVLKNNPLLKVSKLDKISSKNRIEFVATDVSDILNELYFFTVVYENNLIYEALSYMNILTKREIQKFSEFNILLIQLERHLKRVSIGKGVPEVYKQYKDKINSDKSILLKYLKLVF